MLRIVQKTTERFIGKLLLVFIMMIHPAALAYQAQLPSCEVDLSSTLILPEDSTVFSSFAREKELLIILMAPNPHSLRYVGQKGYAAKTADLKVCKSSKAGPHAGLVICPPELFRTHEDFLENKRILKTMGYSLLGPEQNHLVRRDSDGKLFYSDYDLKTVTNFKTGEKAYSENLRRDLNARLGRRLIRHGPLDDYEHSTSIRVKFPLLIFTPDGPPRRIENERDYIRAQRSFSRKNTASHL